MNAGPVTAVAGVPFVSAPARLLTNAQRRGDRPAYFTRDDAGWKPTPWRTYAQQVQQAARALVELGVKPGDAVCILGFNRPEWTIMDLAAMMVGGVAAGIYWTSAPNEVDYIVDNSAASLLLVENAAQWARIAHLDGMLERLHRVVLMTNEAVADARVLRWSDFMAHGAERTHQPEVERRTATITPEGTATLIYTSGTTGPAKGVVITHGNQCWTSVVMSEEFGVLESDRLISYLPLAHIAEQMGAIHNHLVAGYSVYFARSIEELSTHLAEVRPTLFFGVPRVWEKMQAAIQGKLAAATGLKVHLARWAMGVARRYHAVETGRAPSPALRLQKWLATRLVLGKVRAALGFDQARILITGAAPIALETLQFFAGLDLLLGEVYGQSEVTGPTSLSLPGRLRFGSVGRPMRGLEVRIAEDEEILVRGPNVFGGYLGRPDATRDCLGDDGWLHTGDLGRLDADGFLYITGRKKDLIITSGGKNISPSNIEAELMNLPLVEHAVVCGDRRHYLSVLLTLDAEALADFARRHGLAGGPEQWRQDPGVHAELQRGIDAINDRQARVAHVRKFAVLEAPLTIEDGALTATMKIRRSVVLQRHAGVVDRIYAD